MPKVEKAGPVAGTDLRNFDLAINSDHINHSALALQVARLTSRCAVNASMAEILVPFIFPVLS